MAKREKEALPAIFGRKYVLKTKVDRLPELLVQPKEFEFEYSTPRDSLCEAERLKKGRCATHLIFVEGTPHIQFCAGFKKLGNSVPVKNPEEAQKVATKYCRTFQPKGGRVQEAEGVEGVEEGEEASEVSRFAGFDVSEQPTFPPSFAKKAPPKAAPRGRKNDFSRAIWWLAGGATAALVFGRHLTKTQPVK
jgi:hypothetical protein